MVKSSAAQLDNIFQALSDGTRRAILREVAKSERTVGELAEPHAMSLPAISKHLKVLESAGLISRERHGSFQIVRINATPLRSAQQWLNFYERFWTEQLDSLERVLDDDRLTPLKPF